MSEKTISNLIAAVFAVTISAAITLVAQAAFEGSSEVADNLGSRLAEKCKQANYIDISGICLSFKPQD